MCLSDWHTQLAIQESFLLHILYWADHYCCTITLLHRSNCLGNLNLGSFQMTEGPRSDRSDESCYRHTLPQVLDLLQWFTRESVEQCYAPEYKIILLKNNNVPPQRRWSPVYSICGQKAFLFAWKISVVLLFFRTKIMSLWLYIWENRSSSTIVQTEDRCKMEDDGSC